MGTFKLSNLKSQRCILYDIAFAGLKRKSVTPTVLTPLTDNDPHQRLSYSFIIIDRHEYSNGKFLINIFDVLIEFDRR